MIQLLKAGEKRTEQCIYNLQDQCAIYNHQQMKHLLIHSIDT